VAHFPLQHDGQWHETAVELLAPGRLTDLRIDPGAAPGEFDVDWIRLIRRRPHPLAIERVERADAPVSFELKNLGAEPLQFSAAGQTYTIGGGAHLINSRSATPGLSHLPRLQARTSAGHDPSLLQSGTSRLDRAGGRFHPAPRQLVADRSSGQLAAIIGPLVHAREAARLGRRHYLCSSGRESHVISCRHGISVSIDSQQTCEGPVVRAIGDLEQGLFAGLEYLGKGEKSSSKLDIETAEHLRFAPDPLKVTMPLMTFVTERVSAAMTWKDMQLSRSATPAS
jgi:hypothetical protein